VAWPARAPALREVLHRSPTNRPSSQPTLNRPCCRLCARAGLNLVESPSQVVSRAGTSKDGPVAPI